jgi:DNA-binding NarL/FixJ family response regulator
MLRIIIADDHHLVRQGIRALLEKSREVEVVGEAANGLDAVALTKELTPDLVVMDISMPQLDGIQATEQICNLNSSTRVIVLSMHSKPNIVQQALRKGAKGYLLKSAISEELLAAIHTAVGNETYLSPSLADSLLEMAQASGENNAADDTSQLLTARERQVLQLIAEGRTNNEIADLLNVSVKTVGKHRTNLMAKLGVHDLPSLLRAAIKHQLIFVD